MKTNLIKICLAGVFAPLLLTTHAVGATITWDPAPQTVVLTNEGQVSTYGSLYVAVTANNVANGGTGVTVNGVQFKPFLDAVAVTKFTMPVGWYQGGASAAVPSPYGTLLNYEEYKPDNVTTPAYFSGLTIGQQYQLQIWMPYHYDNFLTQFGSASNGSNNSPSMSAGYGGPQPQPQYIFGNFTATATTQNLYQFGVQDGYGLLGALQLRAVPEPQTWALAALGASAVLFRLRRKARA